MTKDIDFVHLNIEPLAISIQNTAKEWTKSFGTLLNDSAKENLFSLKSELEVSVFDQCYVPKSGFIQ